MTKKISPFLLVPVLIPGFLFPSFLGWSLPLQAQESESIFISEIFYTGSLASNQCKSIATEQISNMCSYDKWLEIYNPGSEAVNLKGWRVVVQGSLSEILGEVSVPAESFLVFSNNDYKRSLKGEVEQSSQSFSSSSQISVQNNSQASSQNTQVSSQNNSQNSQNSQSQQASSQTVQSTNSSTNFAQNPSSLVSTSFSSSAPTSINSPIATSQAPAISFSNNQLNPQTNLLENSISAPKTLENSQTELKVKPGNELKNQVLEDKTQPKPQESPVSTTSSILPSLETGKAGPEMLEPTSKPQFAAKNAQETRVSLNSTLTQAGIANYSLGILHSLSPSSPLVELRNNLGQTVARRSYANSTTQGKSRHSVEFDSSQSGGRKAEVSYFGENYGTPGFGFIQKKPQKPEPVTEPVVVTDPVKTIVNAQPSPVIQTQPITESVPETTKVLEPKLQTQTEVQPQVQVQNQAETQAQLQTVTNALPAVQTVTQAGIVANLQTAPQTSPVAQAQVSPALARQLQLQTSPALATQTQNALQLEQKPVSSPQSLPEKITQPAAEIAQKQELLASNLDSVSVENLVTNSDLQTSPQTNYKPIFVQAAAGISSLEQSLDAQKWSVFRPKMSLTQSEAIEIQTSQYYPALVQARRLVLPEIISFDSYSSLVLNFLLLLLLLAKRSKKTRELTNFENQPIKLGLKYFQPSQI